MGGGQTLVRGPARALGRKKVGPIVKTVGARTLFEGLAEKAEQHPDKRCLVMPETGASLSYSGLLRAILQVAGMLRSLGIGDGDRVALLLPNSAEFVVGYFAAMAARGIVVPINPALKPVEVEGILEHSGARAIVVDSEGPGIEVALRGITQASAGYRLTCFLLPSGMPAREDPALQPGDALLMYTSGTTGRPKGVMLQHRNLLASVRNITSSFSLCERDVSLCVLPLTHIHGQIASMVSTLCSGGTLVLPSRFNAGRFWDMVLRYRVTWFSAVPTIFTILLQQAASQPLPRGNCLRFARSASAPLPVPVLNGFEELYGCPIAEAYGLTEATHQAAANPLPPGRRKWSSVGLPSGIQIVVADENGVPLAAGEEAELMLRGESITRGYFEDERANAEAFLGSWFRTGDLGHVDEDGYVYITGRKKEQINRGGQKVSPREVDEVLYRHPKLAEAATVGVPHPLHGEEVEAFVVVRPGERVSEKEIQDHCANYLADYKCPKAIHFVSDLPKSANGKIQRLKLLGVAR